MLTIVDTPLAGLASSQTLVEPTDTLFANHLAIADFAASLSDRLLAETCTDGTGPDDEYLRGYARAMSDLSEALVAGDMRPGGLFCPTR